MTETADNKSPEDKTVTTAPIVASCYNKYLEDQTNEIRSRTIPWEGYQRASLITEDELVNIRKFLNKGPISEQNLNNEVRQWAFIDKKSGERFILLFLNLLQKLVRPDTIQNILVLLDDIITEKADVSNIFHGFKDPNLPYGPFLKLLRKEDEYIPLKAAKICISLLLTAPPPSFAHSQPLLIDIESKSADVSQPLTLAQDPSELFAWLVQLLQNKNPDLVDIGVQYLQSVLSIMQFRLAFYKYPKAMATLVDIFKKSSTLGMQQQIQMQYQTIYIFWLLSFIKDICEDIQSKYDIIPQLLEFSKRTTKEKVVRVSLATIKNLLLKAPLANTGPLLGNKVLNTVDVLVARNLKDSDTNEDLGFLKDELTKSVNSLSTFDEYYNEVITGKLDWSPVHQSEQFWKQNASRLNDRDYEVLRALSRLIGTSKDPVVLSIAAHDIGQYIKYCPAGKKFLQESGTKTQIMMLMGHEHPDVRFQALAAVQKLMTNAWE